MGNTRVLFVTDIHGSDRLFFKLMNAVKIYAANIAIVGGDVAGKGIVPIFSKDGMYTAKLCNEEKSVREVSQLIKEVSASGDYPYLTSLDEWRELTSNEVKMNSLFESLISESIRKWCIIAEERLKPIGARLIMNTGNDDPDIVGKKIKETGFVEYPNEKVTPIDQHHEMISLGYSNLTPWKLPGDLSEERLSEKIESLVSNLRDVRNSIFNIHVPPFNTHLDLAPKLDSELKPKLSPGGEPEMAHVGSTAVRDAIEKYQPLAGLHGHIHESRGYSRIGRTHCFNPGSEYTIGILKGVLLNFSSDKLESYIFTSG